MTIRPVTIFFDVNETLSDLSAVADAFERVGAGRALAATWFSGVLRDGFALTSVGSEARFAEIAETNAGILLAAASIDMAVDDAVGDVMGALASVGLHPDVADGLRALRSDGHRLFTLTNGSTSTAERLLGAPGLLDLVDELLSVEGHSLWKPDRNSYLGALARTGTEGTAYLVAVHPWDIHGATEAGLSTVWVDREGRRYPDHFHRPTMTVTGIDALAEELRPDDQSGRLRS